MLHFIRKHKYSMKIEGGLSARGRRPLREGERNERR